MKASKKFNNIKCEADGKKFDSLKERLHYYWLKNYCEGKGLVLHVQKTYKMSVCKYIADFVVYIGKGSSRRELIIDTKSQATVTDVFKLKAKLLKHELGKDIFKAFSLPGLAKILKEFINGNNSSNTSGGRVC